MPLEEDWACDLAPPPGPHAAWEEEAWQPCSDAVRAARAKGALMRHILSKPPFSRLPGVVAFWNIKDDPAFPNDACMAQLTAYIWCVCAGGGL
jgi:hypothetical protein